MKLILYKFKNIILQEHLVLFNDIPTLGIAFTCIDNWCSDNHRKIVTFDNLQIKYPVEVIWITTNKDENLITDDYDIIFEIK